MSSVTYRTDTLIAGKVQTDQAKLAADTYYRGMPLEYDSDNDRYKYLDTGDISAIYLGPDDADDGTAKTANQYDSLIVGGEIMEGGIVTDADEAYTITEDIIAAWNVRGFFIKRS